MKTIIQQRHAPRRSCSQVAFLRCQWVLPQVASCSRPGTAAAAGAGGVDGRAGRQPCSSRPCGGRKGAAARNRLEARPTWPRRRPEHAGFAEGGGGPQPAAGTLGSHHLADPIPRRIRAAAPLTREAREAAEVGGGPGSGAFRSSS
jgi:hypothetical protein